MSILKVGMYASSRIGASQNYLTFSSDNPFSISFADKRWDGVLEYSTDAENWYEWDASEINSADNTLYLRGSGNSYITGSPATVNPPGYALQITATDGVECTGNIMSLLDHVDPDNAVMGSGAFASLFYGQDKLITAPELPATVLATHCYSRMLSGTGIEVAPELPATTLAAQCYYGMFTNTGIAISETQTEVYQTPWRIPSAGTIESEPANWSTGMLSNTSGTFTGNPTINTTYYQVGEGGGGDDFDPHWDKVVALLHFDGDLTDETGKAWTAQNTIFTTGVFGQAVEFTRTSARARVQSETNSDFALGADDFTIELLAKIDTSYKCALIDWRSGLASVNPLIESDGGNLYLWILNSYRIGPFAGVINPAVFHHIALTREDGTARLFLDGVLLGSASYSESITSTQVSVGENQNSTNSSFDLSGVVDELRITKGVARYTENFTPPTAPFPNR